MDDDGRNPYDLFGNNKNKDFWNENELGDYDDFQPNYDNIDSEIRQDENADSKMNYVR